MSRLRRLFDLAGAAAGLAVFAPIMVIVAAAILADDGRPVLFRQTRVGHRRRLFSILKFRTMRDGRVTRAGGLLRATGLDEIPQFLNILRGDMSAVGPRPLTEADVQRFGWTGPEFDFRWKTKPGLTGLAQIIGARSPEEGLELDRLHATRWDPVLDCQLIALSFVVNAVGKSRVQRRLRKSWLAPARSV
jgi:lipopolysaccharide/colanic/teichoic acid biosynthesis glycosyltransferase